jgi:hypothetical protein
VFPEGLDELDLEVGHFLPVLKQGGQIGFGHGFVS